MRILGDAGLTRKLIDHQDGECDTVAVCDVPARGQYIPGEAWDLFPPRFPRRTLTLSLFHRVSGCTFLEHPRVLQLTPYLAQGWLFPRVCLFARGRSGVKAIVVLKGRPLFPGE